MTIGGLHCAERSGPSQRPPPWPRRAARSFGKTAAGDQTCSVEVTRLTFSTQDTSGHACGFCVDGQGEQQWVAKTSIGLPLNVAQRSRCFGGPGNSSSDGRRGRRCRPPAVSASAAPISALDARCAVTVRYLQPAVRVPAVSAAVVGTSNRSGLVRRSASLATACQRATTAVRAPPTTTSPNHPPIVQIPS